MLKGDQKKRRIEESGESSGEEISVAEQAKGEVVAAVPTRCPRMPIGLSDFREVRTGRTTAGMPYWLADKTEFIPEIIDGSYITLITCPRHFGKTLNLSMLRYFFDIRGAGKSKFICRACSCRKPSSNGSTRTISCYFSYFKESCSRRC